MWRRLARSGSGTFVASVGPRPVDRVIARLVGVERSGPLVVSISCTPVAGGRGRAGERWTRDFGGRRRSTTVSIEPGGMIERAGPIELSFAVETDGSGGPDRLVTGALTHVGLWFLPRSWRLPSSRWLRIDFSTVGAAAGGLGVAVAIARPDGCTVVWYCGVIA